MNQLSHEVRRARHIVALASRQLSLQSFPMLMSIINDSGAALDARIELDEGSITLHSRGGAFNKPNLRNPDYAEALRTIIQRITSSEYQLSGVWLDSSVAKTWPSEERRLLSPAEFEVAPEAIARLIRGRAAAKGRPEGSDGHGNSTKRIRIEVKASASALRSILKIVPRDAPKRLPAEILRKVQPDMIDEAIASYLSGAPHHFGPSGEFDIHLPDGKRLPPKAIFGLALEKIIGRPATPSDFSAGWGHPCFSIIADAGYPIVSKHEDVSLDLKDADEDRIWAEGKPKLKLHIQRERASGLASIKKRRFVEQYGHLFCERCHLVPSKTLGPFGDACIEVHHHKTAVSEMSENHGTRLSDLQCLCANCHRIVHREELEQG